MRLLRISPLTNPLLPLQQVPPGHCWIIGDNLPASRDSRHFGPVPLALVRGKVLAKISSPFKYEWIENPFKKIEE